RAVHLEVFERRRAGGSRERPAVGRAVLVDFQQRRLHAEGRFHRKAQFPTTLMTISSDTGSVGFRLRAQTPPRSRSASERRSLRSTLPTGVFGSSARN